MQRSRRPTLNKAIVYSPLLGRYLSVTLGQTLASQHWWAKHGRPTVGQPLHSCNATINLSRTTGINRNKSPRQSDGEYIEFCIYIYTYDIYMQKCIYIYIQIKAYIYIYIYVLRVFVCLDVSVCVCVFVLVLSPFLYPTILLYAICVCIYISI